MALRATVCSTLPCGLLTAALSFAANAQAWAQAQPPPGAQPTSIYTAPRAADVDADAWQPYQGADRPQASCTNDVKLVYKVASGEVETTQVAVERVPDARCSAGTATVAASGPKVFYSSRGRNQWEPLPAGRDVVVDCSQDLLFQYPDRSPSVGHLPDGSCQGDHFAGAAQAAPAAQAASTNAVSTAPLQSAQSDPAPAVVVPASTPQKPASALDENSDADAVAPAQAKPATYCILMDHKDNSGLAFLRNSCSYEVNATYCWMSDASDGSRSCSSGSYDTTGIPPGRMASVMGSKAGSLVAWAACEAPAMPQNVKYDGSKLTMDGCQ